MKYKIYIEYHCKWEVHNWNEKEWFARDLEEALEEVDNEVSVLENCHNQIVSKIEITRD